MSEWWQALRGLRRRPAASLVAIVTLAIGVGASAALFTVVNGVLLEPLPYPGADRVVRLFHRNDQGSTTTLSDPDFADLAAQTRSFEALAQFRADVTSVAGGIEPTRTMRAQATAAFFEVIGIAPERGRAFTDAETVAGGPPVAIVSARYARLYLDGEPLGRVLRIDDREHAIVGVMPATFDYPAGTAVWTPLVPTGTSRTAHNSQAVARLAPRVGIDTARAELDAIARNLRAEHGDDSTLAGVDVIGLHDHLVSGIRPALLGLLGSACLLFVIAFINVLSLWLAEATARAREFAIRRAVGAGPRRLIRQLFAEASVVTVLGGVGGLGIAYAATAILAANPPQGLPRVESINVDGASLAFVLTLALVAALGIAVAAGRRALRVGASEGSQRVTASRAGRRAADGLVVAQVALAAVLLVGAGLLGRSFINVLAVEPGFDSGSTLVLRASLPWPQTPDGRGRLVAFHESVLTELNRLPGVEHAGRINLLPVADGPWNGTFLKLTDANEITDIDAWVAVSKVPSRTGHAEYRFASEGYFEALRIPLRAGRLFDERDVADAPHAAVISESLARLHWPGESALGQLIHFGNMDGGMEALTVVGVVGDVHESGLEQAPAPTVYTDFRQRGVGAGPVSYVTRTRGTPWQYAEQARSIVARLDPELPIVLTTLDDVMAETLAPRRFGLKLVLAFGFAATALALVGLYSALAFSVSQRTREIGLRIAIGAHAGRVVALVVREGLALSVLGIVCGLVVALFAARATSGLVYGVSALDPWSFLIAGAVLLVAGTGAAWLPARRAANIDPITTLRYE